MTSTSSTNVRPNTSTFRWSRFAALVRVDLAERWRSYGGVLLAALIIQALIVVGILTLETSASPLSTSAQEAWHNGFLICFSVAFCFVLFAPMQRQGASLLILMRPASTLEKNLHFAFLLLVLFPLAFTAVYLLVTVPYNAIAAVVEDNRLAYAALIKPNESRSDPIGFHVYLPFLTGIADDKHARAGEVFYAWLYLCISGYASFALVRFRRAVALKTVGLAIVILIVCVMSISAVAYGAHNNAIVLFEWIDEPRAARMGLAGVIANLLFWLVAPALAWLSGFFALRERDLA